MFVCVGLVFDNFGNRPTDGKPRIPLCVILPWSSTIFHSTVSFSRFTEASLIEGASCSDANWDRSICLPLRDTSRVHFRPSRADEGSGYRRQSAKTSPEPAAAQFRSEPTGGEYAIRQLAPRRRVTTQRRFLRGHVARNRGPARSQCSARRRSTGRASCAACR
jgi:hypothetical protein